MSTLLEKFHKMMCEAAVPLEFRPYVGRMIIGHVLRVHQYKSKRKEVGELIGVEAERLVQEKMQVLKNNYEAQVMLWRAVYCWLETNDPAKAAYRHEISTSDLMWVLSVIKDTEIIAQVPTVARAHWTRTPLTRAEVSEVVEHNKIQSKIRGLLQFNKTGVIWGYDQGITKEDVKSDLEYKAVTTTLHYEAERRSKWHLINVVGLALDNEVKNIMRRSTSKDTGRVIELADADGDADGEAKTKKANQKHKHGTSMNRVVPLVLTNDAGDEFEHGAGAIDMSFAGTRAVQNAIGKLSGMLTEKQHVMDYLKVAVLGEHNPDFEDWLDAQNNPRKTEEDMLIRLARKFFNVSNDEMKLMQEVLVG